MKKISIYGDHFMKSDMFVEKIKKNSNFEFDLKCLDVDWPNTPFHNDFGSGNYNKIKEYYGEENEVIDHIGDSEILLTDLAPITEFILKHTSNLKYIGVSRGGPVNIDINACKQRNITVANAPGRNSSAAAEFTVGLILSETRLITKSHSHLKRGNWKGEYYRLDTAGKELSEMTIGLIGYSHIGKLVKNLLLPFGCKIIFSDPYVELNDDDKKNNIEKVFLEELLETSDVVSLHARVTKETEKMIGEKELKKMKKGSYLINTARGPLLDYVALEKYLLNNHLKGAALDTFDVEPLPSSSNLLKLNNITITPHIAGASVRTVSYAAEIIVNDLYNYLEEKPLINKIC